ncbi:hypothetical protein M0R45_001325 [Rubus argutus]|uniref:Uncharacterized protein n=1 Tax=Rubus argutus TaxID=59490 RepID=A0AAW1VKD5_RUBAR
MLCYVVHRRRNSSVPPTSLAAALNSDAVVGPCFSHRIAQPSADRVALLCRAQSVHLAVCTAHPHRRPKLLFPPSHLPSLQAQPKPVLPTPMCHCQSPPAFLPSAAPPSASSSQYTVSPALSFGASIQPRIDLYFTTPPASLKTTATSSVRCNAQPAKLKTPAFPCPCSHLSLMWR